MSGKKKKRTLKREITLLTMATSFGALVLFGTVMIVMFFVFFWEYTEDMENILQNTLQNYQAKMQFIQDGAVMIRHNSILRGFF